MWTKEDLQKLVKDKMGDYAFIVVSNRQPYIHNFKQGKIESQRGVGGVISALDPVMQACQGSWVAYGNGEADRDVSDEQGRIQVPEGNPRYTLKRVWLTKEEEVGYYYGYSNEVLWPLSHTTFCRPIFRREDWEMYKTVNMKFAQAVMEEVGNKKAFVWIQDYHFCLLPKFLKQLAGDRVITAHFWHIPWPSYETFRICPQKQEILEGLLANDLLGFHIRYHCNNFFDVVDRELECKIDREAEAVIKGNHTTLVRSYPIGVDFEGLSRFAQSPEVTTKKNTLVQEFGLSGQKVLISLDRLDYTKGIPEKLAAMDSFLQNHPEWKKKVVFLQIGVVTRLHLPEYKNLNDKLNALVEEINWKHGVGRWKPVILARRHFSLAEVLALYRTGDVCLVSSLHDGMNLVAKEYISSRYDEEGTLILSQFTGAARELTDAIQVNPYDCDQFGEGILTALALSEDERRKRMKKMREIVANHNIFRWAGKVLSDLLKFEFKEDENKQEASP
ncbi:MAG: trehalose-6-phosphate synthase [Candidatus Omnitrophica bacterium]|nr:trehalose-6-phosphate synthase [Candidatus Omnitrophota bacterium]